jgi:hypothetical protein
MKKIIFLAIMVLTFGACNEYKTIEEIAPNVYTQEYEVTNANWRIGNDAYGGAYYFCRIDEPELTQDVFNKGVMQAFMYYDNVLSPLPFSDFNPNGIQEYYTVEFEVGFVTFIMKTSSGGLVLPYYTPVFSVTFLW